MSADKLLIPQLVAKEIKNYARQGFPQEICGLLAGVAGQVQISIPVTNMLASPNEFRMEPEEQLKAFNQIEDLELDLLAIYHSHPQGPPHPSFQDLISFYYPGVITVIVSCLSAAWHIRGYRISSQTYQEVLLEFG